MGLYFLDLKKLESTYGVRLNIYLNEPKEQELMELTVQQIQLLGLKLKVGEIIN